MAPIHTEIDTSNDLAVLSMEGDICRQDIIRVLDHFYSNKPTSRILWDLSRAQMHNVSAEDLKQILLIGKERGHLRRRSKTALLATRPLNFAMARQISTLIEGYSHSFQLRAFRDQQAAMQWLLMPD